MQNKNKKQTNKRPGRDVAKVSHKTSRKTEAAPLFSEQYGGVGHGPWGTHREGGRLGGQWAGNAGDVRTLDVSAKAAGSRAPPEGWSHWGGR